MPGSAFHRAHFAAGVVVAISGALSGAFVVCANAWMNAPAGFHMVNGQVTEVDPIAGIHAFAPHRGTPHCGTPHRGTPHRAFHRAALQIALWVGLPAALVQPLSGDGSARSVAEHQPVKLAAMEGHLKTGPAAFVITDLAAPRITLQLTLGALAVGTMILMPSFVYFFRVFKTREGGA